METRLSRYFSLIDERPEIFSNEDAMLKIILDERIISSWETEERKRLKEEGLPAERANIGITYEDSYIFVLRDLVKFPSGQFGSYFRILNTSDLSGGQATVILPVVNGKTVLMRQFRHSTRSWHWEVPRGFGEPHTSPETNARKELMEEIEGQISSLIDLGDYHSNTGISGARVRLFYADLVSIGRVSSDEGIGSYRLVDTERLEKMIRDSEITDGFSIAAYTRAKLRGLI